MIIKEEEEEGEEESVKRQFVIWIKFKDKKKKEVLYKIHNNHTKISQSKDVYKDVRIYLK